MKKVLLGMVVFFSFGFSTAQATLITVSTDSVLADIEHLLLSPHDLVDTFSELHTLTETHYAIEIHEGVAEEHDTNICVFGSCVNIPYTETHDIVDSHPYQETHPYTDQHYVFADTQTASVPEPGSLALMGLGLIGLGFTARRKHRGLRLPA